MNIPRITKNNPDKAYVGCRLFQATSVVNGNCLQWAVTGDAVPSGLTIIPGVDVLLSSASSRSFAGVATRTIAVGDYVPIQCYGFHSAVTCTNTEGTLHGVMQLVAAGACGAAAAAGSADIIKERIGRVIVAGAGTTCGLFIKGMGQA